MGLADCHRKYGILFHNVLFSCLSQQIWSVLQIDNVSWHDVYLRQHVTVTDLDIESMFCMLAQNLMTVDIVFEFSRARLGLQMILISFLISRSDATICDGIELQCKDMRLASILQHLLPTMFSRRSSPWRWALNYRQDPRL